MKFKYIFITMLLTLELAACDNNLDIPKHGNIGGMDDFYQTDGQAMEALAAVYTSWFGGYFNWYMVKNALSDDVWCGGENRGDNADTHYLNEYTFGTEHGMVESLYSYLYSIIYNANLIIDRVQPDSDVKKRVIAEAKFFRAFAHFELVTLWGNAPAVDHLLIASEYRQPTGNPATTWALIEQDLTEAINANVLPSKSNANDPETGIRITKETARAYLGKAYVFQEKWAEAATTLDLVINSGLYDLYRGNYGDVLKMVANNSCESILEGQCRFDVNNVPFEIIHVMVGWRGDRFNVSGLASSYSDLAVEGYGFFSPTRSLYNAFVAREGATGVRLNQTMKTYDQLVSDIGIRLAEGNSLHGNEGFFFWKNRPLKSESVIDVPGFRGLQAVNKRVMRYAEVLLLAAEAHIKNNNSAKALQCVNEIRSRAGLAPLGSVTMDDIKAEKRLELCAESVRFQDLVRWGDAPTALTNQGKEVYGFNGTTTTVEYTNDVYGFKTNKHELLPIPGKEMMINPNINQNTGW
jgi:hypothetical protein